MSSDRDGFRGGGNTPVDDQADVESAAETTGEYTFSADAWYTADASSSGGVAPFASPGAGGRGTDDAGDGASQAAGGDGAGDGGDEAGDAEHDGGSRGARAGVSLPDGAAAGRRGRRSPRGRTAPGRARERVRRATRTGTPSVRTPSERTRWARTPSEPAPTGRAVTARPTTGTTGTDPGRGRATLRRACPRPVRRCRPPMSASRSRRAGWAHVVPPWWPQAQWPTTRRRPRPTARVTRRREGRAGLGESWTS
ncbi:SCO5717 family growth-regulating ATPase [Streptomyces sp. S399]|uniref:SCO5717 family growth-regulating ATPase n=1 Tax=Streptomyces sp. S399 TaxID=3096009 RepID=UPI002A7F8F25|nr:SCO5717 family growth-regulating ATPase [Streptomyces sp. S399]WPR53584.1 SCO5717 family growth-regulating ATPase [Streptomyces sp. S399]